MFVWQSKNMTERTRDLMSNGFNRSGLSTDIRVGSLQVGFANNNAFGLSLAMQAAKQSPLPHLLRSKGVTICLAFKF
jgi:hypothetical protein